MADNEENNSCCNVESQTCCITDPVADQKPIDKEDFLEVLARLQDVVKIVTEQKEEISDLKKKLAKFTEDKKTSESSESTEEPTKRVTFYKRKYAQEKKFNLQPKLNNVEESTEQDADVKIIDVKKQIKVVDPDDVVDLGKRNVPKPTNKLTMTMNTTTKPTPKPSSATTASDDKSDLYNKRKVAAQTCTARPKTISHSSSR